MSKKNHQASCCLQSTILRFGAPLLQTVSLRNTLSSSLQRDQPSLLPSFSPSPVPRQHLHLPLLDGTRVLLLLHRGFYAILLFTANKHRHYRGTGIRKSYRRPRDRGRDLFPSGTRGRSGARAQPQPHSQALVPEADHALHDRVLPRLLLLPLQGHGHTAAIS